MSLAPYLMQTTSPELVTIKFRFQAAANTVNPDFLFPGNQGVTDVAWVSAGVYDITFAQKWPAMVGFVATVLTDTVPSDQMVRAALSGYSATTGVLRVTVVGALDTTVAAEEVVDNDWVYMEVTFCRRNGLQATLAI